MSTPPAGASPSPKKSFRGRMGTMLRRSSTAFSRSSNDSQTDLATPPIEASPPPPTKPPRRASIDSLRSSSSSGRPSGELKRLDTSSSVAPKSAVSRLVKAMVPGANTSSAPSPIAESPMREEMETAASQAKMRSLMESPVVVTAPPVDKPPTLPAPASTGESTAAPAPVPAADTLEVPSVDVQEPMPSVEAAEPAPAPAPQPQITESPAEVPKELTADPVIFPEETPAKAEPMAAETKDTEPEAQAPVAAKEINEPEVIVESPVEQVSQEATEEPSKSEPVVVTTEEQPAPALEPAAPEEPAIPAAQVEVEEPPKSEPATESVAVPEDAAPTTSEHDDAVSTSIRLVESPIEELAGEETGPSLKEEPINNANMISHVAEASDATVVEPMPVPESKDSIINSKREVADYFAEDAPSSFPPPPPFQEQEDDDVVVVESAPIAQTQEQPAAIVIPALSTHRDRGLNHSSSESSLNTNSSDHDHVHQYGNPWAMVGDATTKSETVFQPPYANGKQPAT
jgi:hypothetical protein